MVHSYVAYIDESGDEGFDFRPELGKGSSRWFVLTALMVPTVRDVEQCRFLDEVIKPIEQSRGSPVHFHKINHDQKVAITHIIGASNLVSISIYIEKDRLESAALKGSYALYFYATRYLIERISWHTRDSIYDAPGDGRVKLIFSNRTRMSYDDLRDYVRTLNLAIYDKTSIHWPCIDPDLITSRAHNQLVGLRAADAAASGIRCALELSQYGFCEERSCEILSKPYIRGAEKHAPTA